MKDFKCKVIDWDSLPVSLTAAEAAEAVGMDVRHVYGLMRGDPTFPGRRMGKIIRISRDGLRRWLSRDEYIRPGYDGTLALVAQNQ